MSEVAGWRAGYSYGQARSFSAAARRNGVTYRWDPRSAEHLDRRAAARNAPGRTKRHANTCCDLLGRIRKTRSAPTRASMRHSLAERLPLCAIAGYLFPQPPSQALPLVMRMLIKWVACDVPVGLRAEFSEAQRAWKAIAETKGFICQFGGFSSNRAHILSLWENRQAYASFMSASHDDIASKNQQDRFYKSIRVDLFSEVLRMPGADASLIADALSHATHLRMADCVVPESKQPHFVEVQKDVWSPGMAESGMQAGSFAQHMIDSNRFLVASLWDSEEAHRAYMQHTFPGLYKQASPQDDVTGIAGEFLELEHGWTLATSVETYRKRIEQKQYRKRWPNVTIVPA